MKNKMMIAALLLAVAAPLALTACTDAQLASFGAFGEEAKVTCYSGGLAIFEDTSTGKVEDTSAGVIFKSKTTGNYVKTYADCIVAEQ